MPSATQLCGFCGVIDETWFGSAGWNTRTVPNGRYEVCVDAYDAALNHRRSCADVKVAN